ncbi:MAG: hypothetical protein IJV89_04320 [Lentisphaeria bacterium]|nr:hypothetical protein [Lentisphaeria bacterium]
MKKSLFTVALMLCGLAVFAETLWDGDLASVTLDFGKKLQDVSVKTEDGSLLISGTSEGNSVTYISAEIRVKPFVLGDKFVTMEVSSDDAKTTEAIYIRLQNARRKNVLSFQRWASPLKEKGEKYYLQQAVSYPTMKWETAEIKAPVTDPIDRIVIFIGTRGDGKPLSVKVKNIELNDAMGKLPIRPGEIRPVSGNDSLARAFKDGNTVYIDAIPLTDAVAYTYVKIPFKGDLTGKKLVFSGMTSAPQTAGALYVRGYNSKKECILSYGSWGGLLKGTSQIFTLTPGQNSCGLKWETDRAKTGAAQDLAQLELIIGAKGKKEQAVNAVFENIQLQ